MKRINKHKVLSPGLFFFLLFTPSLVFAFMFFPLTGAQLIGADGYLAIPVAFALTVPITLVAQYFTAQYPGLTMIEYAPFILGKTLGFLYNLLYLSGLLLITIVFFREVTGMAYGFLIDRAPFLFVTLLMVGAVLYISYYGITSVARLASFLFPASLFLGVTILLAFQNWQLLNILPIGGEPVGTYLNGGVQSLYIFYPFTLIFQATAFADRREKVFPLSLLAHGLISLLYFLNSIGITGVFTAEGITRYLWPNMEYSRTIDLPFFLFEEVGLVFNIAWGVLSYSTITIFFFFLAHGLAQLGLKSGDFHGPVSYQKILIFLGVIIFGALQLIPDLNILRAHFRSVQIIGGLLLFGLPVLLFLCSLLRVYFWRRTQNG
ncbi:MAG TPA: GerAB/ArcD/ProY family transporter [Bacillota bacterium]